ncbi:MAG: two-component regulator propeller domain-containing protein, partial [Candidatus Latescibacterota bacterium]
MKMRLYRLAAQLMIVLLGMATLDVGRGTWHVARSLAQQPDIFQSEVPESSPGRLVSPRFEKLGIDEGLSQSSILDMMQDRNGFMWFGTQDGLNRFDGYEVKIYENVPFDTTSILAGWSSSLAEDAEGRIWVGTWAGTPSISVMDPVTETFTAYKFDPEDPFSMSPERPRRMIFDRQGALWIASGGGGVDRMLPGEPGVFEHFTHEPSDETSLSDGEARTVYEDSEGDIWIGTLNGLNRFVPPEAETPLDSTAAGRGSFVRYLYRAETEDESQGDAILDIFERQEEP